MRDWDTKDCNMINWTKKIELKESEMWDVEIWDVEIWQIKLKKIECV